MKRMYFFLLLCCLCISGSELHSQRLVVLDETGSPVPYVAWVDSVGQRYLLSDNNGCIALGGDNIPEQAVFCLVSDFYERQCMSYGDMKQAGTVVVRDKIQVLSEISVLPPASAIRILEKAAAFFSDHYAEDYIAPMAYYRLLHGDGQCTRLYAVHMLWASLGFTTKPSRFCWEDKNLMGRALPLDAYVSHAYVPGSDALNPMGSVSNNQLQGLDAYLMNFSESLSWDVLVQKRSLELYSPLNARQIKNFDYSVGMVADNASGDHVYVVSFRTKAGAFPVKTKLHGKGRIYITESGFPYRVELENTEDRYTNYVRSLDSCRILLTPYKYKVEYGMASGRVYTRSVSRDVRWEKPETMREGTGMYAVERNFYRQPFKNKLASSIEIDFGEPVLLTKKEAKEYGVYFPNSGMGSVAYYVDSVDVDFWHRKLQSRRGWSAIEADLTRCGLSLDEQAMKESTNYPKEWSLEYIESYQRQQRANVARHLYGYLYGKGYNE